MFEMCVRVLRVVIKIDKNQILNFNYILLLWMFSIYIQQYIIQSNQNQQVSKNYIENSQQNQMEIISHQLNICDKHQKNLDIFVVNQAHYICQDCALFENKYRNEHLMEKHTVTLKAEEIDNNCAGITVMEESNKCVTQHNLALLFKQIDILESTLLDDIRKQFKQVRSKVQHHYLSQTQIKQWQRNKNGRSVIEKLKKQPVPQEKIRKQKQCQSDIDSYKKYLSNQLNNINHIYENAKINILKCGPVKINIIENFNKLFEKKKSQLNEDLLDFSQYSIIQEKKEEVKPMDITFCEITPKVQPNFVSFKRNDVQRMKTAPCLEDSICSIDSFPKSIQSQCFNIPISQTTNLAESILSQRSITCSVVSRTLTSATVMQKQTSKKFTIEVTSLQQFQKKLITIAPTIRAIRLKNISISSQDFSSLLKQKISKSFIHTLQIINCPKINDKILMDLKSFKCKSLKKLEIKECKEINWADKKVKDLVRKLQSEGVKIVC